MASFFGLGLRKAKGVPGRFEFEILVQEIKPWMPAVPSPVLLSWHRGEKRWGSTAGMMPLIGGSNGDRVYFNESFKIPATLYEKQPGNNAGGYEKKPLLFTLQSATEHPSDYRKTARKTLAMAEIDLGEFASLTTPLYRGILLDVGKNNAAGKPILYFRIDCRRKAPTSVPLSSRLAVGLRGSSLFPASDHLPLKAFNSDVAGLVHETDEKKTSTARIGEDGASDDDALRRRPASPLNAQETRNDAATRRQKNREKLFSLDYDNDENIALPIVGVFVPSLRVARQNSPNPLTTSSGSSSATTTFLPREPANPVQSSGGITLSNDQKNVAAAAVTTRKISTSIGEEESSKNSTESDRGEKPEQILHGLPGTYASYILKPETRNEPVVVAAAAVSPGATEDGSIDKPPGGTVASRSVVAAVYAATAAYEARKAIKHSNEAEEDSTMSMAPAITSLLPTEMTSPVSDAAGFVVTLPSSNGELPRKPAAVVPDSSSPGPPATTIPATAVTLMINVTSQSAFLEGKICDDPVKEQEPQAVPEQSIVVAEPLPKEGPWIGPPVPEQSVVAEPLPKPGWPLLDKNHVILSRTQSQRGSVLPMRSSGALPPPLVIDKHVISKTISEGNSIVNPPVKEMEQLLVADENVNAGVEDENIMGGKNNNNIYVLGEARANLAMLEKRAIEELRKKVAVAEAKATLNQEQGEERVSQLEQKLMELEDELRDSAAIEVALYSITAEHVISSRHMHTPARRLNRLYRYALKKWSPKRRANSARNSILGLVLVVRACGNDVARLTFWWSNVIVLRESIMQAGNIEPTTRSSTEVGADGVPSSCCAKASDINQFGVQETVQSRVLSRQASGKLLMHSDWGEGRTFISALQNVEEWIHARILECVWWQIIAECVERLDVALLNGILRNPANNFPSDPFADPIMDLSVLPIPIGALSFGAGSQLKNVVVQWSTWLSALLDVRDPSSTESLNKEGAEAQNGVEMKEKPMVSRFMRTTGSMLMLPKDMILEIARRREVCVPGCQKGS
ncbi:hypothetical protein BDL97_12G036500 [Sphagnum fallax]|nr:hypothetical protein BDL97_12G036500 [Sphagnum fallax]